MASSGSSGDKMNAGASADIVSGGGNKKGKRSPSNNGGNGSCCNCQKSHCLQLYCECLRAGNFCNDSCSCKTCMNNENNNDKVYEKKKEIELRDPQAFQPKIIFSENEATAKHKKGCNCRKSKCQKKYCVCFSAGVGCHSHCRCEGCMNEFGKGIIKDEQEQHVLTTNNHNGDNDFFDQLPELDMDMVINEEDEAECYRPQMLLADDGENGIHNDNMTMQSNQVNHIPAAATYYNYNVWGNIIQNNVSAPNYHQPLSPRPILVNDLDLLGASSFPGSFWSDYDNGGGAESSSVQSFSMMEPIIHNNQQYEPQTQSYGDLFQQEAPPSVSGAMNQNAPYWQNDATNMQAHSHPNNSHLQ